MVKFLAKIVPNLMFLVILAPLAQGMILDEQGHIAAPVISIFRSYKQLLSTSTTIPETRQQAILTDAEPTLQELNDLAQDKFLRPKGSERLDEVAMAHYLTINKDLTADQKKSVVESFKIMGDIDAQKPRFKKYDNILILGSTVQNMRERIMYLAKLFQNGDLDFDKAMTIVFLTGDRQLFAPKLEGNLDDPKPYKLRADWQKPASLPTDEGEAAKWVYEQLDLPQQMRDIPVQYINSSKREGENRAQTNDTIRAWAQQSLQNTDPQQVKNCLIISSNPFVTYQVLTTTVTLKEMNLQDRVKLEGVGLAAEPEKYPIDFGLGILLDNFARTIYAQVKLENLKK